MPSGSNSSGSGGSAVEMGEKGAAATKTFESASPSLPSASISAGECAAIDTAHNVPRVPKDWDLMNGSGASGDELCEGAAAATKTPARQVTFESPDMSSAGESLQDSNFCVQRSNGDNILPVNPFDLLKKSGSSTRVVHLDSEPQRKLKGILKNSNSNLSSSRESEGVDTQRSRSLVSRSQSVRSLSSVPSLLGRNHNTLGKTGGSHSAQKTLFAMRRMMCFKNRRFPNLAENQENLPPARGPRLPSFVSCSNLKSYGAAAPASASKPLAYWRP